MDSAVILVVEDEDLIASMVEDGLVEAGFVVELASSGDDAIRLIDDENLHLAGLITDIRMPGDTDGWGVARHARERKADFPIVYVSGDSAADWSANGVPNSIMIQKPFASAQIVTAIANLLNGVSPT